MSGDMLSWSEAGGPMAAEPTKIEERAMTWPTETKGVTHADRQSADKVIAQYEMTPKQEKEARALIAQKIWDEPFRLYQAYHIAHLVCSQLTHVPNLDVEGADASPRF